MGNLNRSKNSCPVDEDWNDGLAGTEIYEPETDGTDDND